MENSPESSQDLPGVEENYENELSEAFDEIFPAETLRRYLPNVPDVPDAPDVPDVPDAPDVPDVPDVPEVQMFVIQPIEDIMQRFQDQYESYRTCCNNCQNCSTSLRQLMTTTFNEQQGILTNTSDHTRYLQVELVKLSDLVERLHLRDPYYKREEQDLASACKTCDVQFRQWIEHYDTVGSKLLMQKEHVISRFTWLSTLMDEVHSQLADLKALLYQYCKTAVLVLIQGPRDRIVTTVKKRDGSDTTAAGERANETAKPKRSSKTSKQQDKAEEKSTVLKVVVKLLGCCAMFEYPETVTLYKVIGTALHMKETGPQEAERLTKVKFVRCPKTGNTEATAEITFTSRANKDKDRSNRVAFLLYGIEARLTWSHRGYVCSIQEDVCRSALPFALISSPCTERRDAAFSLLWHYYFHDKKSNKLYAVKPQCDCDEFISAVSNMVHTHTGKQLQQPDQQYLRDQLIEFVKPSATTSFTITQEQICGYTRDNKILNHPTFKTTVWRWLYAVVELLTHHKEMWAQEPCLVSGLMTGARCEEILAEQPDRTALLRVSKTLVDNNSKAAYVVSVGVDKADGIREYIHMTDLVNLSKHKASSTHVIRKMMEVHESVTTGTPIPVFRKIYPSQTLLPHPGSQCITPSPHYFPTRPKEEDGKTLKCIKLFPELEERLKCHDRGSKRSRAQSS